MVKFPLLPPKSTTDLILEFNPDSRGIISKIYNIILSLHCPSLSTLKTLWEQDLGLQLTDDIWDSILARVHSSSVCARHGLIQFKILHRLHLSKVKLSRIYPELDPACDRCKLAPASLIHMFWSCPRLAPFWTSVFETLSQFLQVPIDPTPLIAIFCVIPDNVPLTGLQSDTVAFATLLARHLILFGWKQAAPPSHVHWIRDLMYSLKLEKIKFTLRGSTARFYKAWQPFLSYVDNLRLPSPP